ncbi:MAG: polysaccharide biosynthesis protein [Planctomycetes bacterium]|nr:polysaccharide biosynthesis protein [Planctomycetota bacterium]
MKQDNGMESLKLVRQWAGRWRHGLRDLTAVLAVVPILAGVHTLAYWLRFDGVLGSNEWQAIGRNLPLLIVLKLCAFAWCGALRGWNRCVTFHDLMSITKASTAGSVLLALADYLSEPETQIARSVFLLDWSGTLFAIGAMRSWSRLWLERRGLPGGSDEVPVIIVGANDSGEALLRSIRRNRSLRYRVLGFITDNRASLNNCIDGVPVIGELQDTCELAARLAVTEILITAGELPGRRVRPLMEKARRIGVGVKVVPSHEQLLHGNIDVRPRCVSIEDLLHREPVRLNLSKLHAWLDDRVLMVTGSAGSIGSEICRQLLQFNPRRIVLVDRSENGQYFLERELLAAQTGIELQLCIADVGDTMRMSQLMREHRPQIVFHAAAYKHVPLMESHPGEAVKNTVFTTRLMADLAHQNGVESFVMISTDKAVNPTSVMGACKRAAELYVQALAEHSNCRFLTVRFGNVLDSAGSVVPIFRDQIQRGGPVTVTHPDMIRYFMTIPEASQLVIQAGAMGNGGEIFVLDMGEPVRIVDLARDMIRLSGLELGRDIEIEFTGIRPGEKLFEELHLSGERHLPTSHPKILVAESHATAYRSILTDVVALCESADGPRERIYDRLQQLIPQYRRQISPAASPDRLRAA